MTGVGLRIDDPGSVLRRLALGLGLAAAVALQIAGGAGAVGLPGVGGPRQADPCAAERAPIVERQKQYEAVRRSHLGQALGAGLKKGALFFGAQMLNHYVSGLAGGLAPSGVGLLSPSSLQEAGNLQIPGVTTAAGSGAFAGANLGASDTRSIAALAVVVAVVGTVDAYVQLKEQEAAGDPLKLAGSIDQDAGRQIAVNQAIAAEETALAACRAREVADYQSRLGGASNADDRRAVARDKTALQGAIKKDVDLTGSVVDQQAGLAKTYTQGRAMAEGTSEADVLAGQKPAYADAASTAPLKLPPPPQGAAPNAPLPPPPPPPPPPKPSPPVWTTAHALTVRSAASAKSAAVASLAAGVEVDVRETVKAPQGWSVVKLAGRTGYVRTSNLVKTTPPPPPAVAAAPALAPPSNIREHNRAVIAARQDGPDRLKTLLTDVEAQRRHARPALA